MPYPKKYFEIDLDARTNAGRAARLVALAAGLGLLATGAIFLTWVFSIKIVFFVGMIGVALTAFAVAWKKRERTPWIQKSYLEELTEATRTLNLSHIGFQRSMSLLIMSVGVICVGLTLAGVGADFTAPFIVLFPAVGLWSWRIASRRDVAESIDDPHERQAARSDLKTKAQTEGFWALMLLAAAIIAGWIAMNLFGFVAPRGIELLFQLSANGIILFYIGAVSVLSGLNGPWIPAEAHCVSCGYEYDVATKPQFCSECGGEMSEGAIAHWRRARNIRLVAAGAVFAVIGALTFVSTFSVNRAAVLARTPTAGLIARVAVSNPSSAQSAWAELQTRMPLSPGDRDRLIERVISRAIAGDSILLFVRPGLDTWLTANWPGSAVAEKSLGRLNAHVEARLAAGRADGEVSEAVEVLFLMPAEHSSAEHRATMHRIARHVQENARRYDYLMAGAQIAARAWLDAGEAAEVLER